MKLIKSAVFLMAATFMLKAGYAQMSNECS